MSYLEPINHWDFPVELMPTPNAVTGDPEPDAYQVVRTDTNKVLGHHGSRYKLVPHQQVVESIIGAVTEADITKDYELSVDIFEDGRKMRGQILFPDLVTEPEVGDIVQARLSFTNSYDASWSFAQMFDALRLWCKNGCTTPDAIARSKYKHTTFLSVDGSAAKIRAGIEHFHTRKDEWQAWMKTKVEQDFVESFFKKTICKGAHTRQLQKDNINQKQLENLLRIWDNERSQLGANKWALYNCLTYWATHTDDARTPHVARYNRETDIAKAMSSTLWKGL